MSWIKPEELTKVVSSIIKSITEKPFGWFKQSQALECDAKYINLRIDQRTGHFIITGDVQPCLNPTLSSPSHMLPEGWSEGDDTSYVIACAVNEITDTLEAKADKQTKLKIAEIIKHHLELGVKINHFQINNKKTITHEEFKNNWD